VVKGHVAKYVVQFVHSGHMVDPVQAKGKVVQSCRIGRLDAKMPIDMQESANDAEGSGPDLHAEGSVLAMALASSPSIDYSDSGSLHSEAVLLHDIDW
jgi:hypothetical protein